MKQTTTLLKSLVVTAMLGCALASQAQKYEISHGRVFFSDEVLARVDIATFVDLGCGYAKDRYNVYMDGRVLENVDPATFRLKERSTWRRRGHADTDVPVEITQELKDAVAAKAFCIHGHGFSVVRVTYK